ncbi:hypothetical protein LCGC14_1701340 [marine sediment metagenome]|uniref:Uncharacterized protein n=1 Tax=marine sediment metagenome TaxID=412755 RepID=A0A0F9HIC8_9ZZZZ
MPDKTVREVLNENYVGKVTYRRAFADLAGVAGSVVTISGVTGVVVKVTAIQFAKPSVAQAPLRIVKYSTAISGGTSTEPTPVPLDSNDPAARATFSLYTAVPTDGTEVGALFDGDIATGDVVYETFGGEKNVQPVVLRGTAEYLAIELSANAVINGFVEWTEEAEAPVQTPGI